MERQHCSVIINSLFTNMYMGLKKTSKSYNVMVHTKPQSIAPIFWRVFFFVFWIRVQNVCNTFEMYNNSSLILSKIMTVKCGYAGCNFVFVIHGDCEWCLLILSIWNVVFQKWNKNKVITTVYVLVFIFQVKKSFQEKHVRLEFKFCRWEVGNMFTCGK